MLFHSEGDLLQDYKDTLIEGVILVAMPIARVEVGWAPINYPGNVSFYPAAFADIHSLNVVENKKNSTSLAEVCSEASGINEDVMGEQPLVVFPCQFDWANIRENSHRGNLELIRRLSDYVDRACLNFIRYCQCAIEAVDCLPGRAGQISSNQMMSGALLYDCSLQESRIIGGDAFTHFITKGIGLPLEPIDHSFFPKVGEVGALVNHALRLYTSILEASDATAKFIQLLSLLEFLAYPYEYRTFQDVKKIIARYVATDRSEYRALLERFFELTGKKGSDKEIIGYRTKLIHMGGRIEDIVTKSEELRNLFVELDGYVKKVINHMIEHSDNTFDDYLLVRDRLRRFELT